MLLVSLLSDVISNVFFSALGAYINEPRVKYSRTRLLVANGATLHEN